MHSKKNVHSPKKEQLHCPTRWLEFKPFGEIIPNTRFIPFKTPISKTYFQSNKSILEKDSLTTDQLVERLKMRGMKLGLVIDLTSKPGKYYNPAEWELHGVQYAKIASTTDNLMENRQKFFAIVNDFLSRDKEKLIGVHCAHGLNRTGFLICSYLVEYRGYSLEQAISDFETARGHKMETRKDVLHNLYAAKFDS